MILDEMVADSCSSELNRSWYSEMHGSIGNIYCPSELLHLLCEAYAIRTVADCNACNRKFVQMLSPSP